LVVTSQWTSFMRAAAAAGSRSLVEPLAQLLAGLEEGDVLLADMHAVAGARVAAQPRFAPLHLEGTEALQFDAVAPRQRGRDLVEDVDQRGARGRP
jgi:hypothetical protein